MVINTDIRDIIVEIDGAEYPVAAKTIDVAEKLEDANRKYVGKARQYELWLAHLRILLGAEAVKEIFPGGKKENLDRMEAIYIGCMRAFNYNRPKAEETERQADELKGNLEAIRQVNEFLRRMDRLPEKDNVRAIRRNQ